VRICKRTRQPIIGQEKIVHERRFHCPQPIGTVAVHFRKKIGSSANHHVFLICQRIKLDQAVACGPAVSSRIVTFRFGLYFEEARVFQCPQFVRDCTPAMDQLRRWEVKTPNWRLLGAFHLSGQRSKTKGVADCVFKHPLSLNQVPRKLWVLCFGFTVHRQWRKVILKEQIVFIVTRGSF